MIVINLKHSLNIRKQIKIYLKNRKYENNNLKKIKSKCKICNINEINFLINRKNLKIRLNLYKNKNNKFNPRKINK